jgi:ribosomal protein L34E
MSRATYVIASISNAGGAPEQAYRKLQSAAACPERPYGGTYVSNEAYAHGLLR